MVVGELKADFDKVERMHDEGGYSTCTEASYRVVLMRTSELGERDIRRKSGTNDGRVTEECWRVGKRLRHVEGQIKGNVMWFTPELGGTS